jgi:hypothetical protein
MNETRRWQAIISFLALSLCALVLGCGDSESGEQTFYVGWTILGAICLGMVLLVAGFIRYIRQGSKGQSQGAPLAEYEYQAADDADESDPFRQP